MVMNQIRTLRVSTRIPEDFYNTCEALARGQTMTLEAWMRAALLKAANMSESEIAAMPKPVPRLTPAKRAVLTFLESQRGMQTTADIAASMTLSQQTVYNTLSDMRREGLIQRGENVSNGTGHGAPFKAHAITELGLATLTHVREAATAQTEAYQKQNVDGMRALNQTYLNASVEPLRKQADQDTYQKPLHGALRYIAMARLGRTLEGEADLAWVANEAKRLCTLADTDVAQGKATFEAHHKAIMAKIDSLGGFQAISEKFNIG